MRFLAEGPSIPDDLLVARDEGRVVFFCGAGVSRARAGLPDFFGLAQNIIEALGVPSESPAKRIIDEAREIADRVGESGLISADRVFGLLERQFLARDIHAAVAKALIPTPDVDLSAHRVMLDLARGQDGRVRLVTTNFDRLFEACDDTLRCWWPPRLPDPRRYDDLEGIVHLHGRVNASYNGAEGEGFVLSSSEFGRAYLSEAWATEFIRSILDKYLVVFVGYTADDPPVQYLLEALNYSRGPRTSIYAFQSGDRSDAQAKWLHKGVLPIAYEESEGHGTLWNTMTAWSTRARDVDAWYQGVISSAQRGPEALSPHQRGQVAHTISTLEGIRGFASSDDPPPAEWLCVFDPQIRYSLPRHHGETGRFIDPFVLYGLDDDPIPEKIDSEDHSARRETPQNVWDGVALSRRDQQDIAHQNAPGIRGYLSTHVPSLPARLQQMGIWIGAVAHQPAAVWWAAGQHGIHRDIQKQIQFGLERKSTLCSAAIRTAWRYIFEAWDSQYNDVQYDWLALKASIAFEGWTNAAIRALASMYKPRLVAERPFEHPRPPQEADDLERRDMVSLDVRYPELHEKIQIPDAYVVSVIREFRKNLESAVTLEQELGGYGLSGLVPIEPDPDLEGESSVRSFGVAVPFLQYVDLFKQLLEKDVDAARQEYFAWWVDDETIFARLRLWAYGESRLFSGVEAAHGISRLSDGVFWDGHHERDLLLVLARRWANFPSAAQTEIETKLLSGPLRWDEEEEARYVERCAWSSLNRIYWLNGRGCKFTFDIDAETAKLQALAPNWRAEYGARAAASIEASGGWVRTEKQFEPLVSVPLADVLAKAIELSGRRLGRFIESDPFAGLASSRPVRALSVLTISAKAGNYPDWAWRTFLNPDARKSDKLRLTALVAERVSRIPTVALAPLLYSVSDWLLSVSKELLAKYPRQFERLWAALILVLQADPDRGKSSVVRGNKEADWATEALNAPVGKLAQALMNESHKKNRSSGFSAPWLNRVDELLSLEGDRRRHALVIFSFNLKWFYAIDPAWTERWLLAFIDTEGDDKAAVWAGLFWGAGAGGVPTGELYSRLKLRLFELAKGRSPSRRGHLEALSAFVLLGWGRVDPKTGQRAVSDAEARDVLANSDEALRSHILWQLARWSKGDKLWLEQVGKFLSDVWPRQKKAKSSKISARLCELALSNVTIFPRIVDILLPLVTKADGEHLLLHELSSKDGIVEKYPERTLALLYAVLPDDISVWPYRVNDVLERIGVADSRLLKDSRLLELKRRWNAR